jgi:hypothetical protein
MWIDLDNIRNATITSDEWVDLVNIMAQAKEMTDKDYDRLPGMKEWVEEVRKITKENYQVNSEFKSESA